MQNHNSNRKSRYGRAVNTRLSAMLEHEIQAECKRLDIPMSQFTRKALEFYLAHTRARQDLLDLQFEKRLIESL